jgi:hyperosmotically inducible periplasmic protein
MKLSFIALSAALVICLAGCERRSASDTTITTAVKNKLAADPTTSAARINVDTSNGIVTLSGKVPTTAERSEAERIARNTQGVTQVVNNISAEQGAGGPGGTPGGPGGTSNDATIQSSIKSQYAANGITGTNVDVKNGEVTITGEVDNAQEKARAEEIASKTSGVKSVKNQLTIKRR